MEAKSNDANKLVSDFAYYNNTNQSMVFFGSSAKVVGTKLYINADY